MSNLVIQPGHVLRGVARVPGDKSISHRAVMLGALADGASHIEGFLPGGDCMATLQCMRELGIEIHINGGGSFVMAGIQPSYSLSLTIRGKGLRGLQQPAAPLNCVRSGTTMRLLAGVLAGQTFESVLTGEVQLLRRPMRRITEPLRAMGASIDDVDGKAPLTIRGRTLHGFDHSLTVASAQVKSAILLAGLFAEGKTVVRQPGPARDHTERMLAAMGANISTNGLDVILSPLSSSLAPLSLTVPGDISSAAFPLVAALLVAESEITLEGIGINPTRTGLLDVLQAMGANITLMALREQGGEPVADVTVRGSRLTGTEIGGDTVVRMIDEFPVLAVAATQAHGATVVRDARELRVKETDRIATVAEELTKLGANITPQPDGFVVEGPTSLQGSRVNSHGDHRLGMALAVAGLVAEDEVLIENAGCIADSFPGFVEVMTRLGGKVKLI
ncbi:MAG: 3-phosphoshikimate 1-carboxyvinyltransferase [Anaerolineae bacterium]|nr:3-phosphoshikimate 1-carboxyvinyltransferase [Anaerolineae bacterium]